MKQTILRLLLVMAVGLSAAACSQDWERPDSDPDAEEVVVTFSISAESGMVSTRAGEDWHISDGTKIDKLVYALYIKNAEGGYTRLDQYGDEKSKEEDRPGQTVLSTDKLLESEGQEIILRLMRGQEYVIAFWAQNSSCKAYDTKNLEAVVVDYTAGYTDGNVVLAPNNDETRDAFCQMFQFTAQAGETHKVVLKRAMAQINVGTAGWDYINEVEYGNLYVYSKIVMKGLYDQLNVLTGEVAKTEAVKENGTDKEIIYNWAKLPAYFNQEISDFTPEDNASRQNFAEWLKGDNIKGDNINEEFLRVKLTTAQPTTETESHFDGKYLKYLKDLTDAYSVDGITSEVFKYLSMCYVLAPTYEPEDKSTPAKGGTTIAEIKFYLAETVDGKYQQLGSDNTETMADVESPRFLITEVPIQRNWRTNILGGTRGMETTLFDPRNVRMLVDLSPGFNGEHNYNDQMNGDVKDKDNEYSSQPSAE